MNIFVSPPFPDALRVVKGQVLTGVITSLPHWGHLTKPSVSSSSPSLLLFLEESKICFAVNQHSAIGVNY
jgi:hypothetical protein